MPKKLTKRQDGKRLNEEGRLSPLEVLQDRMEYHDAQATEEKEKGAEGSKEKIATHFLAAQDAASGARTIPAPTATGRGSHAYSDRRSCQTPGRYRWHLPRLVCHASDRRSGRLNHEALIMATKIKLAASQFADPAWRLNNLYYIVDKNGHRTRFQFNWAQAELYKNLHYHNIILKARQLGISTFASLFMLDRCIFNGNVRAGTVAHDLPSAKGLFRDKVKYPYENLPEGLRNLRMSLNDPAEELLLANNSSLRIATSMRSGT